MPIDSAQALIDALRASELFTPEQLQAVVRAVGPLGDDPPALMRHLVERELVSLYVLRKIVHGKAADLRLGPYVVTDKLGEGGMGKVYRGRAPDGRDVALKIVRPKLLANAVIRKRYEREVATARTLKHPNVVEVFDAGESGGRHYLAMEFVDGIDLSRLVREHGLLTVPEACEYLRQAALGLQHAHQAGLVHRDMKPSNIIVSGERHIPDATGPAFVKILDMGLVRSVGFEDGGGMDLTRAGTVVGTPDYMAPEQARNSSGVDHRADLYSLGCAFYFLLTGKPPFHTGTAVEKLLKHQVDPPPPLQAVRPDVPGELAQVVARLMAKEAERRPSTAAELAAALAPLTVYPAGAVSVHTPAPRPAGEIAPASTPSTIPPSFFGPGSSVQSGVPMRAATERSGDRDADAPGSPVPEAPAVSATDKTPRPSGRLPSTFDLAPPDEAEEPTKLEVPPAEPVRRVRRKPPPPERSKAPLVAAAVVGALLAIGAAVLIAVRSGVFS